MLVEIGDKIISTEIFSKEFVCDLSKCKGACCVEGSGGAPLKDKEVVQLTKNLDKIKPYMSDKGISIVDEKGVFHLDEDDSPATNLIHKKECCFVYFDESNTAKCAIETSYQDGKIDFNKPVSCHLYPIRTKDFNEFTAINYESWDICNPACALGQSLKIPVYKFLKDPIIREFGSTFFEELVKIDKELSNENQKSD